MCKPLLVVLLDSVVFSVVLGFGLFFCFECLLSALKETERDSAAHSVCWSGSKHQLNASSVKCKCKNNDILRMCTIELAQTSV